MKYYFVFSIRLTKKHSSYKKQEGKYRVGEGIRFTKKTVSAFFSIRPTKKTRSTKSKLKVSIGVFFYN